MAVRIDASADDSDLQRPPTAEGRNGAHGSLDEEREAGDDESRRGTGEPERPHVSLLRLTASTVLAGALLKRRRRR